MVTMRTRQWIKLWIDQLFEQFNENDAQIVKAINTLVNFKRVKSILQGI